MEIIINVNDLAPHLRNLSAGEIVGLLNNMPFVKTVPRNKGRLGEKNIENFIKNFMIEKKNSYGGDLIIYKKNYPNIKIVLESKNYEGKIPLSEWEKFERDCSAYAGGIFVANGCDFECKGNLVVLNSYAKECVNSVAEMLWQKIYDEKYGQFWNKNKILKEYNRLFECLNRLNCINVQLDKLDIIKKKIKDECWVVKQIIENMTEKNVFIEEELREELTVPDVKYKNIIESYFGEEKIKCFTSNVWSYVGEKKKMIIKILKKKEVVYFVPRCFDFEGLSIKYDDGFVVLEYKDIGPEIMRRLF